MCWRINDLTSWTGLASQLKGGSKRILIVGAGMIGCELAEDLARAGHDVTLLDFQPKPLISLLPQVAAERLESGLTGLGIKFEGGLSVSSIQTTSSGMKEVKTNCGKVFEVDVVVAATGLNTEKRLAATGRLDFQNGIRRRCG